MKLIIVYFSCIYCIFVLCILNIEINVFIYITIDVQRLSLKLNTSSTQLRIALSGTSIILISILYTISVLSIILYQYNCVLNDIGYIVKMSSEQFIRTFRKRHVLSNNYYYFNLLFGLNCFETDSLVVAVAYYTIIIYMTVLFTCSVQDPYARAGLDDSTRCTQSRYS